MILKLAKLLLIAQWASLGPSAQAVAAKDGLAGILRQQSSLTRRSIRFTRLSDGKVLYEQTPHTLLTPASVTKLITSAAVMTKFMPQHRFHTRFYYTGKRSGGTINGDLYIVGDGDPYIVSEKLYHMAADIYHMGVRKIAGRIVIDNSLFDREFRDQSRMGSQFFSSNAYDAPITAFGINFNTVTVAVAPAKFGGLASSSLYPYEINGVSIDNRVRTTKRNSKRKIIASRSTEKTKTVVKLSGSLPVDANLRKVYRSVGKPVTTSGEYVRSFLQGAGVVVTGQITEGRLPAKHTLLYDMSSYDMGRIIKGLNKYSNNFIADVLVKRLGAAFPMKGERNGVGQGSFKNGLHVIRGFLRDDVGITDRFVVNNGSGLSTKNRFTAAQVIKVLAFMENNMALFPEFLASLPASGWDGTLKKRFDSQQTAIFQGQIRAKTGTLSQPVSVAGLAGYVRHPHQGLVAFAIIENGRLGKAQPNILDMRARQDRALAYFMNHFKD